MSGHAACAVGTKIFMYGGRQGSQVRKYLRRLYVYDTGEEHICSMEATGDAGIQVQACSSQLAVGRTPYAMIGSHWLLFYSCQRQLIQGALRPRLNRHACIYQHAIVHDLDRLQ